MGNKKDIGKFFENKLSKGQKAPTTGLWDKINASLDQEMRRRKKLFLLWIVGGSLSTLLIILFLMNGSIGSFNSNKSSEQIVPPVPQTENSLEKEISGKENKKSSKEPSRAADENKEVLSRIYTNTEDTSKKTENNPENTVTIKEKRSSPKSKSVDENFSVTKKYYYYNSSTDTQIVTTNKAEIDSLVSENNKAKDTITEKKSDNLPH